METSKEGEISTEYKSDIKEINELFGVDSEKLERISGIKRMARMPRPDVKGDKLVVRVLYYKKKDGGMEILKTVSGKGFRTTGVFLNVEEVDNPGVELDLRVSTSLWQGISRELYNRGEVNPDGTVKIESLPGRVLIITADYWTAAPLSKRSPNRLCSKCGGVGCDHCTVTGTGPDAGLVTKLEPPTVYNVTFKDDAGIDTSEKTIMEF